MDTVRAVVGNTDINWFRHFRPRDEFTCVDEVNFWRPRAQQHFRSLDVGQPFFFRLKHPFNAIAGFGFFAVQSFMAIGVAWEVFGTKNGDPSEQSFRNRIAGYRHIKPQDVSQLTHQTLNCLVLREACFLPRTEWIPWGEAEGWAKNIVAHKRIDLSDAHALPLLDVLRRVPHAMVADLDRDFAPLIDDERVFVEQHVADRIGQGTFRARLLAAYDGRCAITEEHAVPVLDAAHIQPYLGPASNHVQNGLLMRTDLHRLYDGGYLTVTPDLRLEVSRRLKEEFDNGKAYYEMAGRRIVVPANPHWQPSRGALEWHAEHVFH